MMPPFKRLVPWFACLSVVLCTLGCSSPSTSSETKEQSVDRAPATQDGMTAVQIVERMVEVYHKADTYTDDAVFGQHFVRADDGVKRQTIPLNVSVLFKRPNRYRITRLEPTPDGKDLAAAAIAACDGKQLEGAVSWLEPQRLRLPAPEVATLETVAPDPMLHNALFPVAVQDIFPQLALLLTPEDQKPWPLVAPAGLTLLPPKDLGPEDQLVPCYRVRMQTNVGPQVLWIAKKSFLLLRMEISNDQLCKQLYPHIKFNKFVWQFDFLDVRVDAPASRDLFRMTPAKDGGKPRFVTKFEEPPAEEEKTQTPESSGDPVANDEPEAEAAK